MGRNDEDGSREATRAYEPPRLDVLGSVAVLTQGLDFTKHSDFLGLGGVPTHHTLS